MNRAAKAVRYIKENIIKEKIISANITETNFELCQENKFFFFKYKEYIFS